MTALDVAEHSKQTSIMKLFQQFGDTGSNPRSGTEVTVSVGRLISHS